MEAELQPYQFLQTDYNKSVFEFTNDKTTASYSGASNKAACFSMTRPIGCDHRLILNIVGVDNVCLWFTTCDTASLLANDKHLLHYCGSDVCSGRMVTDMRLSCGSQVIIRRTTDNRIEAVVRDASDGTSTEFRNLDVAADVPVVPVVFVHKNYGCIGILPDEAGLQSVRSQIEAATAMKRQLRHDVLTAVVADWNELRSVVQSTQSKLDQQNELQDQLMKSLIQSQGEKMQLIQDQVSSLKSELSADHDHKIHVLENKIREQSELISSLQDQVEQMKVGSPPVACHEADFSSCSWLSNDFVSVNDSVMQRIGDIDQKNYSFRSTTFATGTTITFVISGVAKQFGESLTFGVTVYSPDQLDMQSLPANGLKLQISCSSNFWFIANDFLSDPKAQQVVCLKRTSAGVVMATGSEERLLFSVDPHVRLFPFFLFDGYVQAIQLKEFKMHNRTGLECVTCLEKVASTRAKPCGHILYCSDCREGATLTIGNRCPVCEKDIVKYKPVPLN